MSFGTFSHFKDTYKDQARYLDNKDKTWKQFEGETDSSPWLDAHQHSTIQSWELSRL